MADTPNNPRPTLAVGDGVKVYLAPGFFRRDAVLTQINNNNGNARARTVQSGTLTSVIRHRNDVLDDEEPYWTELPIGYVAGSEGH